MHDSYLTLILCKQQGPYPEKVFSNFNGVIEDLVKDNSNELSLLLFKEQAKVKKYLNVEISLSNEKTIDEYRIKCDLDLKLSIINEVNFLEIKDIYYIVPENIVKMSEE